MENNTITLLLSTLLILSLLGAECSCIDQVARLRALRRAKRQVYSIEEWVISDTESDCLESLDEGGNRDDEIRGGLPGQPLGVMFKQYSGYVCVDKMNGRSLFYYFVEALDEPSHKPLVLWLNGGPGCSSLGMGAMVEIGPFGVKPNGRTLYLRRHSWNGVANMLFLESPAGVGYSYSNISSDYTMAGDKRTATDTYTFLVNWFKRYPHYKDRDFYIAGESYAGYYIPELADVIISRNSRVVPITKIQLKGIMIGNGIMNDATDERGDYDYIWSHALISDETYQGLIQHCVKFKNPKLCDEFEEKIGADVGKIDFYNIYSPVCSHSSNSSISKRHKRFRGFDPCEVDYVHNYLNLPQVQQALHANVTKLAYPWELCSFSYYKCFHFFHPDDTRPMGYHDEIQSPRIQAWKDSPSTMFPIYRRLISSGLKIHIYSGDADAVVPVSGTRYAMDALKLKVMKNWHPWSDETEDVCGYRVIYEGLTFTTVRGAGHQVPQNQPSRALALFKTFLTEN